MNDYTDEAYELKRLAESLGRKYIQSNRIRYYFIYNINNFINDIYAANVFGEVDLESARHLVNTEIGYLKRQDEMLRSEQVRQYAVLMEKNKEKQRKRYEYSSLALAGIGFAGGAGQILTGAAIGFTPMGIITIAHGANNIYENGYFILYRENTVGPIRYGYHLAGDYIGMTKKESDLLYATVDVTLSVGNLLRNVLKPESFRLFHHIHADYIMNWQTMGSLAILTEIGVDIATISPAIKNYRDK